MAHQRIRNHLLIGIDLDDPRSEGVLPEHEKYDEPPERDQDVSCDRDGTVDQPKR
jgi:hypothetical protein